ncbi:MAG: hypothetical protein AB1585_10710 [Thermodesulfobacteriota bacterium]
MTLEELTSAPFTKEKIAQLEATYGMKWGGIYYRIKMGIPLEAPRFFNGHSTRKARAAMAKTGQPGHCLIRNADGRPEGCMEWDTYYGGCREYQRCLDYAIRRYWRGWKKVQPEAGGKEIKDAERRRFYGGIDGSGDSE